MRDVLLTGATGFIGRRLLEVLTNKGVYSVTCSLRRKMKLPIDCSVVLSNINADSDWSSHVVSGQVVIHAAAKAHNTGNHSDSALSELRKINVDGTLNLAKQAAEKGARRFIFLSSIGVNGYINSRPFRADDQPNPSDPYAQSKWEAEQGLWDLAGSTDMDVVIIRPPLVYGPNAPGNFRRLVRSVSRGVPLPLGAVNNRRTLVALDNLVDLIIICVDHPSAANQLFLAGDGEDFSTTELLRGVGKAMGKPVRLVPVPPGLLMFGASILGKKAVAQRLLGSLQVDISKARNLLGWEPPLSVEKGLRRCFVSENEY